jgi:hypothetical protein
MTRPLNIEYEGTLYHIVSREHWYTNRELGRDKIAKQNQIRPKYEQVKSQIKV